MICNENNVTKKTDPNSDVSHELLLIYLFIYCSLFLTLFFRRAGTRIRRWGRGWMVGVEETELVFFLRGILGKPFDYAVDISEPFAVPCMARTARSADICALKPLITFKSKGESSPLFFLTRMGGGGFFLACENYGRMFDYSFPICAFFFQSRD